MCCLPFHYMVSFENFLLQFVNEKHLVSGLYALTLKKHMETRFICNANNQINCVATISTIVLVSHSLQGCDLN